MQFCAPKFQETWQMISLTKICLLYSSQQQHML